MYIERSGEELFGRCGRSGVVFGATVLAAATSLPELSTGLTSTRVGIVGLALIPTWRRLGGGFPDA
ncbi:Ca2+/Na+ antiporter [Nocardia kruczakiae]|uniref:Ca2+/Na+ antiporter n=1 Tax=Nocardia kruczakiae TaxID=261477 RepID=A0ABU1X7B1_9NOCA|nr:hypothetical protein [Nocardia kruczakiae]MDR7166418.1 Ca2+/Na+ antiporter [Nocardia kruczakiae]